MQHAIHWFEIPVADLTRAMRFYEAMTGAKLRREAFGAPGEELGMFEVDSNDGVNGALLSGPQAKPSAEGTVVYLNCGPHIDAWLARVVPAGGKVVVPKTALPPGMGHFAQVIDSEGNRVGLHSPA